MLFSDTRKEPVETGADIFQLTVVLVPRAKLPLSGEMMVGVGVEVGVTVGVGVGVGVGLVVGAGVGVGVAVGVGVGVGVSVGVGVGVGVMAIVPSDTSELMAVLPHLQ